MSYKPYKLGKALWYAFLIWIIDFVWGTVVFMMPVLKNLPSVSYISKYPVISVPLLIVYVILVPFLSKGYLKETEKKIVEGLKFGIILFLVNIGLDALVYVVLFKGEDYFAFFSIWLVYAIFVLLPWVTGRWLERKV